MGNRLLLIVDPQIDFISGALPVKGASVAMDALAAYVRANARDYTVIIVTQDFHPADHISFNCNGGEWPVHCVAGSVGAELWPQLREALEGSGCATEYLLKGESAGKEEYSIFKNPASALRILDIVNQKNIEQIDICGIAGDICVADTLEDGIQLLGADRFRVLLPFAPSIDGGKRLSEIIRDKNLKFLKTCDR